jgi:NAD(P)-dependent dehydrogenase (short-subunit alcohol dehydrogenase family)
MAGMQGSDGEAVYAASKHGLRGFSRALRFEALRDQILVLEVYLGAMSTSMVESRKDPEKCIQPDDAARLVVSVCADYPSLRLDEIHVARRRY